MYRIWQRIQRYTAGKLRVNLLLNHASPWADIDSYIPYTGRVDVKIKQPVDLSVRIPEWATPQETRSARSMVRPVLSSWDGRYAGVGSLKPGRSGVPQLSDTELGPTWYTLRRSVSPYREKVTT